MILKLRWFFGFAACFTLCASLAFGRTEESAAVLPTLTSTFDQLLTLRKVGVLPVTDNTIGVYARPIEDRIRELIRTGYRWDLIDTPIVGTILTPSELESDPETILRLTTSFNVEALFAARAVKGPTGMNIEVALFLGKDGRLILREESRDFKRFETVEVQREATSLFNKILSKIPYSGFIMSRNGTKVTLNLGSRNGLKAGDSISALVISDLRRHPKFHFLTSVDKEILGRIKLDKVETTLSFGTIQTEKEKGVIQKNTKVHSSEFVHYDSADGTVSTGPANPDREQSQKLAFGETPKEWVPVDPPSFGRVGFLLGLGSYTGNINLTGLSPLKTQVDVYPTLSLLGELWITPEWIMRANIQQGIISASNPRSGSSPSKLNLALNRYTLQFGYNYLLQGAFFGPKIQVMAGFTQMSMFADASEPLALTSNTYNGLNLGLSAEFPIELSGDKDKFRVGVALNMFLRPSLNETPQTSAASSENSINQFSVFGGMKTGERTRIIGSLDIELFTTTFSGAGTRTEAAKNASHRFTTASGGLEYSF